jgi:hypothetical protein
MNVEKSNWLRSGVVMSAESGLVRGKKLDGVGGVQELGGAFDE